MLAILAVTVPFFALILMGYLAARRGFLALDAVGGLNTYVLYFALPCMLVRFGIQSELSQFLNPLLMGLYFGVALVVVASAYALARWRRTPHGDAAFCALVGAFPNSGFVGVPLILSLLGAAAAGPVISTLVVDIFFTTSLCLALLHLGHAQGAWWRRAFASLVAPLRNPLPWSIALGALMSGMGWRFWAPLDALVNMLAASASPVALFTLGAVLWRSQGTAAPSTPQQVPALIMVVKLVLHPALVFGVASLLRSSGWDITPLQITAITLVAALPSASNVSMLAERMGANDALVARIILCSTVGAFATFALVAWAFDIRPIGP